MSKERLEGNIEPPKLGVQESEREDEMTLLIKELVLRGGDLDLIRQELKEINQRKPKKKRYGLSGVEEIFNAAKEELREKTRKDALKKFVKISTYSDKVELDQVKMEGETQNGSSEYNRLKFGDKNYYSFKARNNIWGAVSSRIQDLLKENFITDEYARTRCEKFRNYSLDNAGKTRSTKPTEIKYINKTIELVIKELIQQGDEDITSDIIKEREKLSEELKSQTGATKDATQERIDSINKTIGFVEEQLELLKPKEN